MLTNAIFEVFEKMFFIFAEPIRDFGADYQLRANLHFSGPMKGMMRLSMNAGLAKLMATNMLNLQNAELTTLMISDCVKESLNMICGNFVRRVDPEHVFQLSIPALDLLSARCGDMDTQSGPALRVTFDTEAGTFEIMMTAPGCM
jgi:CheY-specific phosphatase CheX